MILGSTWLIGHLSRDDPQFLPTFRTLFTTGAGSLPSEVAGLAGQGAAPGAGTLSPRAVG